MAMASNTKDINLEKSCFCVLAILSAINPLTWPIWLFAMCYKPKDDNRHMYSCILAVEIITACSLTAALIASSFSVLKNAQTPIKYGVSLGLTSVLIGIAIASFAQGYLDTEQNKKPDETLRNVAFNYLKYGTPLSWVVTPIVTYYNKACNYHKE